MNANEARRSIFTLGRFQILAEAFEKLDKQGKPQADSHVHKGSQMRGQGLEERGILEGEIVVREGSRK